MSKAKALALFSGGLDSMLAVKVLEAQGIEVGGVCFESNFFNADKARESAQVINLELKIIDISKEVLGLVKNPPSGYGKHLNPCLDCHSLMVKKAGEISKKEGYDFLATGEVLGQRPFSQNKEAMARIQELAGTEVIRPLSAKLLEETEIEKNGLVIRGRLLSVQGRTRDRQFELARKYGIKNYPSPAGGCLLTDPEFSDRLAKMMDYWPELTVEDVELLKNGRVFWLDYEKNGRKIIVIVGRHKKDNEKLGNLAKKEDVMVELKEMTGPTTLIRGLTAEDAPAESISIEIPENIKMSELQLAASKSGKEIIELAALLTGNYSVKAREKQAEFNVMRIN